MSYRGPQDRRQVIQVDEIFRRAGYTATWRQYISASAGDPDLGLGDQLYYREQVVTALIGSVSGSRERQTMAGIMTSDEVMVSMREHLARRDELRWRGVTYRVESDPVPASLDGCFVAVVKRGE